jgi:hypothetical protein
MHLHASVDPLVFVATVFTKHTVAPRRLGCNLYLCPAKRERRLTSVSMLICALVPQTERRHTELLRYANKLRLWR